MSSFINCNAASYVPQKVKCNLQSGVFMILLDFAENYSFVLQDEAQGFH
jgi:hypothetical protein